MSVSTPTAVTTENQLNILNDYLILIMNGLLFIFYPPPPFVFYFPFNGFNRLLYVHIIRLINVYNF